MCAAGAAAAGSSMGARLAPRRFMANGDRLVIVGGGLAGLAAGCYGRVNGWRTTVVEHNLALGGVCTAWQRGPYTIDGCLQWLTGGPFMKVYRELEIIPPVAIRPLKHFATYRDARDGLQIDVTSDLSALGRDLRVLAPEDGREIDRLIAACRLIPTIEPPFETPRELTGLLHALRTAWEMRHVVGDLVHFRSSAGEWARARVTNPRLRRVLSRLVPDEAPAFFLAFMLGYLERGWLSRPVGGTAAFRDALVVRYQALGGEARVHSTVEEVLVERDRAVGVRLTDGTMVPADVVVSTASAPETVLRLLAGRYGAEPTRRRLERWRLIQPIVLASFGVALPLSDQPGTLLLDGLESLRVGGSDDACITVRIFNDEPAVAPPGHTVVQVIAETSYDFWATRGTGYGAEKDAVADALVGALERHLPGLRAAVRMTDVATPLTFWRNARSWRGAFEGWIPRGESSMVHVDKTLPGLDGFYMAGQWVEPGGGVPTALSSGRQVIQILCDRAGRRFTASAG